MSWREWRHASQWAAYLEARALPVKAASKRALADLVARRGDRLSAKDLSGLMLDDPLFALRLLKEANRHPPRRLGHDITTPLGAVLALGSAEFAQQLHAAPEVDPRNTGFAACEARAALAARIAYLYAGHRFDLDPGEIALAALLSDSGEIELWAFVPELPQAALAELRSGHAMASEQAQQQVCGFAFKELTLLLSEHWQLPPLILQLIRGDDNLRAQLARLAVATARHLDNGAGDPDLMHDVSEVARLTGASLSKVTASLPGLSDRDKASLLAAAAAHRAANPG